MSHSSVERATQDEREGEAARRIDLLFTLAAVAETTASLVLITDAQDRIEWVNPSFTRVTGWKLDEVVGLTPREVLDPAGFEPSSESEAGGVQPVHDKHVVSVESKLYRKNGQPYWALVEVRPMPDETGAVRRHLHLHTDTTERVLAERRAKETYRWLQLAGSVLGLGLWHTSLPDGTMLWDANLKSIFGLAPDAPTPTFQELIDDYVLPEDQLLVRRSTLEIPEAGAHTEAEFRIRRVDGVICTVVSRQACIEYEEDGQPRRMLGAVLDVTEARNTTLRLRDALRRLRLAAEASGIGAWERDLATDRGDWDPTMFTLQGLLPADTAPSSAEVLKMVHPDDRDVVDRAWQRMIDELRPVEYEYRIVKADGAVVHMVTRGVVERHADGQPWRAIGTAIDVTHLRQAERERDELVRRIELVADAVGLGIWELEPQVMRVRWNDRMYALYGHTRDSFMPRRWAEVVHPEDRRSVQQALDRAATAGGPFNIEFRVVHPDGRTCWLASRGRGEAGADGNVARVVGVNWDITERVQMEQSALTAERTARDLLDRMLLATSATGLGVWEHVVANGENIWDPQMYQLFGRQPADGAPRDVWRQAVHPDDLPAVDAAVNESIRSGRRFEAEFRVLLPDGGLRWIAGRGLLRDGASGRSLLGVNWDITERRLAEAALRAKDSAERASAAKSEFLSRMSHELRTPLNAILGFTQLLQLDGRQPLNSEQVERVDHIRQAGWHLLDLINEVLDLSRIEAGAARIDIHPVVVREVLDECLTLIAADASLRRVQIGVHVQGTAAPWVLADRTRLKQVVLNLLSNAVKYNRERGHVDIEVSSPQVGWCTIAVRDTGHGISVTKMDKLFQPFNRLGLESAKIEGTGIGLTIALKLAEQMGGRLEASSEPGVGSEFRLTLRSTTGSGLNSSSSTPAAASPIQTLASSAAGDVQIRNDVAGSLLYVEDNLPNVELVQQFLLYRPGVSLFHAPDGASALLMAPACQPDLMLLDMRLPDTHGLDLLRELRRQPGLAHVRCVALSANASPRDMAQAREVGVGEYLTKPLDISTFLRCIDAMLTTPH